MYDFEYDSIIYFNSADESAYLVTNHEPTKKQMWHYGAVDVTKDKQALTRVYSLPPGCVRLFTTMQRLHKRGW